MLFVLAKIAILGSLLAAAVVSDLRFRRVPNAVAVGLAACGLFAQTADAGLGGLASAVLAALVAGVLLWGFWDRGYLGGGDLKLAVGAAAWAGLGSLPAFLLATALAGGLLAGLCYAASAASARVEMRANLAAARLGAGMPRVAAAGDGRVAVPYAAAIAAGLLAALGLGG